MKSNFLTLNLKDAAKAILLAFITALITGLYQLIQVGLSLDWTNIKPVLIAALGAAISYLIKNFFTNSKDEILSKDVQPDPNDPKPR